MKIFKSLIIAILVTGCATSYQPQGFSGGFSSTQLDKNVFTVSFKGNAYTDHERANDFTMLRSAEITLENGYTYFSIVDAQQHEQTGVNTTPTTSTTTVNANTFGTANRFGNTVNYSGNTYGTATTTTSGGQTFLISKPSTSNTIVCYSKKPDGFSYNAEFIVQSLKSKYGIK